MNILRAATGINASFQPKPTPFDPMLVAGQLSATRRGLPDAGSPPVEPSIAYFR